MTEIDKNLIKEVLGRGVVEVIERNHLEKELASGKKLRIKFGIDPTAPDLHLGHTVPLRKLRQFQDAGHQVVLIIGDFTARIGDPTGRSEERRSLSEKEVKQNMKNYLKQAARVINIKKTEIHYNSKWLAKNLATLIEISRAGTIQQVLHRADFKKRIDQGNDITLLEVLYPLFQGYDSVKVAADVEIGGTDQKFNLLMGRRVQRHFKMAEQDVITLPLLEGTDGVRKMSKSFRNYIGLNDVPEDMFGKIMSIPDGMIVKYSELITDLPLAEMEAVAKSDPRSAKIRLAQNIVAMYHNQSTAEKAKDNFAQIFSKHNQPEEVGTATLSAGNWKLIDLLVEVKLASSKSEARRLIEQGGVKIDNVKKTDPMEIISSDKELFLQVGKRHFLKVRF
ncbi:MAG: tyrosine--tRNA ligase [bacterium]|nr:tyrosine--tRNA ligase [bacterium]